MCIEKGTPATLSVGNRVYHVIYLVDLLCGGCHTNWSMCWMAPSFRDWVRLDTVACWKGCLRCSVGIMNSTCWQLLKQHTSMHGHLAAFSHTHLTTLIHLHAYTYIKCASCLWIVLFVSERCEMCLKSSYWVAGALLSLTTRTASVTTHQ